MTSWPNTNVPTSRSTGLRACFPTKRSPRKFPADVWTEATARWNRWSPRQQQNYNESLESATLVGDSVAGVFAITAWLDLLFVGLAIVTASMVGSGGSFE